MERDEMGKHTVHNILADMDARLAQMRKEVDMQAEKNKERLMEQFEHLEKCKDD